MAAVHDADAGSGRASGVVMMPPVISAVLNRLGHLRRLRLHARPDSTSMFRLSGPFGIWMLRVLSVLLALLCGLHLAYLLRLQQLNPAPASAAAVAQLPIVPIEVLQVEVSQGWFGGLRTEAWPLLAVRLVDDTQRVMEFPAPLTLLGSRSDALDAAALHKLVGCMGYVRGQVLLGAVGTVAELETAGRFRIWELHCGPVHHRYEEFRAAYDTAMTRGPVPADWHWGLLIGLCVLALFAWLLPVRRKS